MSVEEDPPSDLPLFASRSRSLGSVSSEGSAESHVVEQEEMEALTRDVRDLKEAIGRLHRAVNARTSDAVDKVLAQERLSEILRILRQMLERYPLLQSNELAEAASYLIYLVKESDLKDSASAFDDALDGLALAVRGRVTEYLSGDLDSNVSATSSSKNPCCEPPAEEESLTPEQMDALLMRHEQGVDHALFRAKVWSKYSKDVMSYVEKRCSYEMEFARNVTKLAQAMRPLLKEESYLPFQSIYCTALDQDLEMAAGITSTSRSLQSQKFLEPLAARRAEHERMRKLLKDRWYKELKKMHESVNNLRKAKGTYLARTQEYERCREAVRIAEQGAEIGATGENKVDKRKRLEEEAHAKTAEAEAIYRACVAEANARHRNLLFVKAEFLTQIRELILMCDQTMKAVTVSYFGLQSGLLANLPVQFQTLCESARLYEPGSQFMEYVKRMPKPQALRFANPDPFSFEPYSEEQVLLLDKVRKVSGEPGDTVDAPLAQGTYKVKRFSGWSAPEPSDTESVESRDSGGRSQETSPSASPLIRKEHPEGVVDFESEPPPVQEPPGRRQFLSKAAQTHQFRKLKTFSKCRECDSFLFQGYECLECGLSSHKKCLETLAIQCGHKRLLRKMTTFGVDLSQHLSESGSQVPPLVLKCLHEIDRRGILVKGIYRTSGVKSKVEKLCQSFENGAELVELTDVTPNVIANVLKLYLRQLPEPLLTTRLYPEFIRAAKSCPAKEGPEELNAELRGLVTKLPRAHLLTLANLMHHLRRVAAQAEANNMPASNLAIVFGPTLLRTAEGADLSAVADAVHQARAVELLILNASEVFGSEESVRPRDYLKYTSSPPENKENAERRDNDVFSSSENPILAAYLAGEAGNSEDDDTDIPDFLLPESATSLRSKKSPLLVRNSSPPKIIKQSLKNFSGLEGVTPGMLSTQDSLEVVQRLSKSSSATSSIDHSHMSPVNSAVLVKQKLSILPLEVSADNPSCSSFPPSAAAAAAYQPSGGPLFAKVGKSAKKHSLDDDHITSATEGGAAYTTSPEEDLKKSSGVILRSYQSPSSGRSSLLIGIGNSSYPPPAPRSSSLSVDSHELLNEHRRKLQSLSNAATILNLEENKVKIQVPGSSCTNLPSSNASASSNTSKGVD